jgi:nitrogen fixation protein NifU and related proteins
LHDFHLIPISNGRAPPIRPTDNRSIDLNGNPSFRDSKELQQFLHVGNRGYFPYLSIDLQPHTIHRFIIIRTAFRANQVFRAVVVRPYNSRMNEMESRLRAKLHGIYSETTIEHIVHPHNTESIPDPDGFGVYGSGCGESMKIWLRVRNDIVDDAGFWTDGCAATVACGSMATDLIKGKTAMEALAISARNIAHALVDLPEGNFHCAELAVHTLRMAIKDHLSIRREPWKKLYRK